MKSPRYISEKREQKRPNRPAGKYQYVLDLVNKKEASMMKDGSVIVDVEDDEDVSNVRRAVRAYLTDHYTAPAGFKLTTTIDGDSIWITLTEQEYA